jgi:hypothetical protein
MRKIIKFDKQSQNKFQILVTTYWVHLNSIRLVKSWKSLYRMPSLLVMYHGYEELMEREKSGHYAHVYQGFTSTGYVVNPDDIDSSKT